jgi:hypothetical protein
MRRSIQISAAIVRVAHFAHEPLHPQNDDETNGNTGFLQSYPDFAADALLEIDTAIISAVSSLDKHSSVTYKHFLCPEIVLQASVLLSSSAQPCQDTHF